MNPYEKDHDLTVAANRLLPGLLKEGSMIPCYILDVDGTVANNSHRTHYLMQDKKDWDSYHKLAHLDKPIPHIIRLISHLSNHTDIVFCTGRDESQRWLTEHWLDDWLVTRDGDPLTFYDLYMRKEGDHRPDHIIKKELYQEICKTYDPIMVFDDRNSVVKMWREIGVPCAQVADGDF